MTRRAWRRLAALAGLLAAAACYGYAALAPSSQLFGAVIACGAAGRGQVALTFDDGPDPSVTPRILDALRAAGAHATFFVVGERALRHPELVRRMAAEGHLVASHSSAHRALPLRSRAAIEADLRAASAAIAASAPPPRYFRPPYGFRDGRVLAVARELGLDTVLWSCSPRDWQEPEPETIVERTLETVADGDIVLLHDGDGTADAGRPNTAAALPALLAGLAERGLRLVRVDELERGTASAARDGR